MSRDRAGCRQGMKALSVRKWGLSWQQGVRSQLVKTLAGCGRVVCDKGRREEGVAWALPLHSNTADPACKGGFSWQLCSCFTRWPVAKAKSLPGKCTLLAQHLPYTAPPGAVACCGAGPVS